MTTPIKITRHPLGSKFEKYGQGTCIEGLESDTTFNFKSNDR